MFKLLIADDEQLERDALRFIISRSIDSIMDIEEAVNGRDAIAKVKASRPDIVILDINMPGINGLEAARMIREEDDHICIIILTAFDQFDYAHEAIKIGVEDYIVKPSSEKRIIEVMEKITAGLAIKKEARLERENIEMKLDKATDYLSSEFIFNLATRNLNEDKFKNYLSLLDMDFITGRGLVMKLDYSSYPIQIHSNYQKQVLKKRVIRLITGIFIRDKIFSSYNMEFDTIFILLYCSKFSPVLETDEKMTALCSDIRKRVKENLNINILLGIGSLFKSGESSLHSFTKAGSSVSSEDTDLTESGLTRQIPIELEIGLEKAVIAGDRDNSELFYQKIEHWSQVSSLTLEKKKSLLKDITAVLRYSIRTRYPEGEDTLDTSGINKANSLSELMMIFKVLLNEILERIIELDSNENSPLIKKACDYIKMNFHRDISLEETAGHCNLSTFYFSKIFKENMQQNFINYLSQVRMEEGKRLLRETQLSMKVISSRIGYSDPNYFARVFKRLTDSSPSEYRSKKMLKPQKMKDSTDTEDFIQ